MATSDRQPLLKADDEDGDSIVSSRRRGYQSNSVGFGPGSDLDGSRRITVSASPSFVTLSENDFIAAIFVVAFDTRSGNMIEWCLPEDTDLDGVEFKAMPSGSHTLERDFVYFRKDNLYGLSCFQNMPVESEIERGARMKSVGILSYSYTNLYRHMQFLEAQVRHQLETPGMYTQLTALYSDRKAELQREISPILASQSSLGSTPSTPSHELLPEMKITHPAGCFAQFINFFGEHVFTLWKFALLQRRIIFFSPPPIGVVCYRVYCACCLGSHNVRGLGNQELRPHFYINVADIETLENEVSYIACTTEKIFESKCHLYDIYVDNQNIISSSLAMKDLLKTGDADREKLTKLNNQRAQHLFPSEDDDDVMTEEEIILMYFNELNERLFHTLLDISTSHDRQLTSDHMKAIGLDPVGDRTFLMELVEYYGIDVVLMVDNPCCPK